MINNLGVIILTIVLSTFGQSTTSIEILILQIILFIVELAFNRIYINTKNHFVKTAIIII
jgi:hypothetical protein